MSEPITNVDIEDVLSSIRRLVSEDARPGTPAAATDADDASAEAANDDERLAEDEAARPDATPAPANQSKDRLVLTPALRIASDTDSAPEDMAETRAEMGAQATAPSETGSAAPVAPSIEDAAVIGAILEDAEVTDAVADAAAPPLETSLDETDKDQQRDTFELSAYRETDDDTDPVSPSLERTISELGAAVDASKTDYEPEDGEAYGSDQDRPVLPWAEQDPDAALAGTVDDDVLPYAANAITAPLSMPYIAQAITAPNDAVSDNETAPDDVSQDAAANSGLSEVGNATDDIGAFDVDALAQRVADIAASDAALEQSLEAALSDSLATERDEPAVSADPVTSAEPEPSPESPEPVVAAAVGGDQSTAFAAEADLANEAPETPEMPSDDAAYGATAYDTSADEAELPESDDALEFDNKLTLDEEVLRELVADIVREELQGALGERITRNVRKLVRREIHRALALQELE